MAGIDISPAPTILSTGLLQLQNGVAMSTTLTSVTDQSNTASPLKLSTNAVQVLSTLRITTADNPYIDAEDNSGNNRFTVGRDPSSQQVNVDFASNPTGSTTNVGAIRTYVDGTNLSEVMTFREDGYINAKGTLQVGTDGQNGTIVFPTTVSGFATSIFTTYVNNRLTLQCGGSTRIEFNSWLDFISSGNTLRIDGGTHTTTLSTNNTTRFVNTGSAFPNTTYFVNTNVGVNETSPTAKLQIKGSGSTSATTSLLVQNSAGNSALQVRDDNNVFVINNSTDAVLNVSNGSNFGLSIFGFQNSPVIGSFSSIAFGQYATSKTQGALTSATMFLDVANRSVGIGTTTPNSTSILDLTSTTKGFLPPRMTNAQRTAIATPAVGLMVYCTDAVEGLYVYKSTGWTFVI